MKLLPLTAMLLACPLSELQLVESHPYAAEIKGTGEKARGTRNFREINQTMSRVTGVATKEVEQTYRDVVEMLPRDNAIDSFSGPVQVGIVRLASDYCEKMLNNQQLRQELMPEFDDRRQPPEVVFAVAKRPQIATLFIDKFLGVPYRTSEEGQRAVTDLVDLIDQELLAKNNSVTQILLSPCTTALASAPLIFN